MNPVVAIVGPTASGKTTLAVQLALALGGEVVSTDSMQIYTGMNIGTATPTEAECRGVIHHMMNVCDPRTDVTVARFQSDARQAIDGVRNRDRIALVTGGSGLYVAAVLDELDFPGTDPAIRSRLEEQALEFGGPAMHNRLNLTDPVAAATIPASNVRRVIRALEVNEITGANYKAQLPVRVSIYPTLRIGLRIPRDQLDARIAERVDCMFDAGFIDEVRDLQASGVIFGRTAARALGYSQVLSFLNGEIDEHQARRETVDATKRFARRQQRWFNPDPRIMWLDFDAPDLIDQAIVLFEEFGTRA
jgi:tRNA dimethylallyltransferase